MSRPNFLFEDPNNLNALSKSNLSKEIKSKEQKSFEKLLKEITYYKKELQDTEIEYDQLLNDYTTIVAPIEKEVAIKFGQIALKMDEIYPKIGLSKRQKESLEEVIIELLDASFSFVEPDNNLINLFDKYSNTNYEQELKWQEDEAKEELSHLIWEQFGIDIDPDELEDNEAGFEKFRERLKEEFDKREEKQNKKRTSKKSSSKDSLKQIEEDFKNKTLRNLFLSLAKILHPDSTTDEAEKNNNEELMKEVTKSYEAKDFFTLLKIELKLLSSKESTGFSAEALKVYIKVLKEQVKEIKVKIDLLQYNMKYQPIAHIINDTFYIKDLSFQKEFEKVKGSLNLINRDLEVLNHPNPKRSTLIDLLNTMVNSFVNKFSNSIFDF